MTIGTTFPRRGGLSLIVTIYSVLVVLYAVNVPRWNAPDEPAHFNYLRFIAERGQLPILQVGDFDAAYLERLKAARFPAELPIDSIRYESHQPPLYYLLAGTLFRLTGGLGFANQVLLLRLLSGALGLLLILVAYATVRRLFPSDTTLALAVPAFLAFLPMHLAVNAAIGNDPLANLILAVVVFEGIAIARTPRHSGPVSTGAPRSALTTISGMLANPVWRMGIWLGLALLTKTTAYPGLLVAAIALLARSRHDGKLVRGIRDLARQYGTALVFSGWWFLRNGFVYGVADPLGLQRQSLVAADQPHTGTITWNIVQQYALITFQSFWGQFGWMGVPLDRRTYQVLAALSLAALLGLALRALATRRSGQQLGLEQRTTILVLAVTAVVAAAGMALYSVTFFQPQGRYLFPALVPIAIGFTVGLRQMMLSHHAPLVLGALALGLCALDFFALFATIVPALRG